MAGNTLTEMMYVPNFTNSTILRPVKRARFWQLDEWIDQFENLSQANKDILKYASVEGSSTVCRATGIRAVWASSIAQIGWITGA